MAIKTTQGKTLNAYKALNSMRKKVKGKDALALFHLKRIVQENVEFHGEEEKRIIESCGGVLLPGGTVVIEDPEKRMEFLKAQAELREMECELKTEPVTLSLDNNQDITMEEIEDLEGFVNFE